MSRETLLDDAIAKAKEAEDWQLAEWLRMARGGESAARWYSDKLREAHRTERNLLDKNARLRKLVRAAWKCIHTGASCSDCRLIAGGCTLQTAMRELGVEVDDA